MLDDKVILITGACGKLGKASTRMFLERGAKVAATDRSDLAAHPVMKALMDEYGEQRLQLIRADVKDEAQVEELIAQIRSRFGRLDGSFHNAYAQQLRLVIEYTLEEWEEVVRGTLTSTFLICKNAIQLMIESGGGVILNTSSVLAHKPAMKYAAYGAAKSGIEQLTRVIAVEYASQGIRANCIVPGDFKENIGWSSDKAKKQMKTNTLVGRSGTPQEIAEFAAFLLSDAASYITAAMLTIDGGYRL